MSKKKSHLKYRADKKDIEDVMSRIKMPFIKNHKWTDEEGNKYSSWDISTDTTTIRTGDGGMRLLEEAFKEEINKELLKLKNGER